jgi:zinc/manganese transport system substrate-binding protein
MKGRRSVAAVTATALATMWLATAGAATGATPSGATKPVVVAAENFYGDVVSQIAGNHATVISIISDPNADPHEYESSATDAAEIARANLVIMNGLGYDDFVMRMMRASPNSARRVINVQQLTGHKDGDNVHLWYDPATMPKVAQAVTDYLVEIDPANAQYYRDWSSRFLSSLGPLRDKIAQMRARYAGVPVAFTEPVFGYMADALGLTVLTPEAFMRAVEDGIEPPASAIAENDTQLRGHQVKVLLYNLQTVTRITTNVQNLAKQLGIPIVGVSETEPFGKTFQAWQLSQLDALDAALGGGK